MRRVTFLSLLSLLLISLLSSCGGDGGGESTSTSGSAPIATSVAATAINEDSATLNGTVNPNGLATQAWFEFDTDPGLQTPSSSPNQDVGSVLIDQSVSTGLSVLAPGTTYYFRVCAENSGGYSEGQIMSFTTASPGSPPAVTTLAATSVGATGATLNGSVIPNGLETDAWFEWGTDPALAAYSTTGTQAVGSGTASQAISQALTGLATGTIYYYRAAASNGSGTSKGTILSFLPGAVPTVTTLAATSVGSTGATLNGNVNPNGLATDAWFEWGTDPALAAYSTTGTQAVGSGTASQAISQALTGLATGTVYYYRVAASNGSGTSKGTILSFLPGTAPTVTTLAATSVGATNATLNGNVNPNALATDAWFEWGTDPSLVNFNTSPTQALGDGTISQPVMAILSGLSPVTIYYYRVAASNSTGTASGSIASFTTASALSFEVVSTIPADNATDVPLGSTITVTFSRDVDPATLVGAITVSSLMGDLPGVISYNTTTKTATFTPAAPFAPLTDYIVTVDDKVKSEDGVRLSEPYLFGFKTGSAF